MKERNALVARHTLLRRRELVAGDPVDISVLDRFEEDELSTSVFMKFWNGDYANPLPEHYCTGECCRVPEDEFDVDVQMDPSAREARLRQACIDNMYAAAVEADLSLFNDSSLPSPWTIGRASGLLLDGSAWA